MDHTAYPLRFAPLIKRTIWGGEKLGTLLHKPIGDNQDNAESWEIVDHGADQSIVQNGPLQGLSLGELMRDHRHWLLGMHASVPPTPKQATTPASMPGFPLLLKYLDCNRVLSVQVHPDDAYGSKMDPPDLGKTEAWYVVDAEPGSLIYAGLKQGVTREQLALAVEQGRTDEVLHQFEPQPGDCVFIPAGTVHALGAGLVIAEIQQSSDTTFRLFDWNRVGADGKPRPLHIEASLDVTDYASGPISARRSDNRTVGWTELVRCEKFELASLSNSKATLAGDDRFHIVTVPDGTALLKTPNETMELIRGDSLLLPAQLAECSLEVDGDSTVLAACLPDPTA
ncbi:MAG: type I phosphomannose isomerase catalytic subunit [Planctomycetota bacterium]